MSKEENGNNFVKAVKMLLKNIQSSERLNILRYPSEPSVKNVLTKTIQESVSIQTSHQRQLSTDSSVLDSTVLHKVPATSPVQDAHVLPKSPTSSLVPDASVLPQLPTSNSVQNVSN